MATGIPLSHILPRIGNRYGRLTAISPATRLPRGNFLWVCRCDCGTIKLINFKSLASGGSISCGCFHKERTKEANRTHGASRRLNEYRIWLGMKSRCSSTNLPELEKYGNRGITVCQRWIHSFPNFYADMGPRPKGKSLDRINNDGNYEPSNCRWADLSTQARNTRKAPCRVRSRFKGIYVTGNGKWQAQIRHEGENIYIGTYDTEVDAAHAYDNVAINLRGHDAETNAILGRYEVCV